MRKYLIYIVIALAIFIAPIKGNVNAEGLCENRTIVDYRELLKNVRIYSDYRMVGGKALFDVTITNIPYKVYIEDVTNNKIYKYENFTTQNELIIKNYSDNQKITYRFYTEASGCYGEVLGSRIVTLPNYNENATDPLCEGIEEFSLCQKWGGGIAVSYSELEKRTNEYREKKGLAQGNKKNPPSSESLKNKIISFIGNYYIYLVAAVAIIVLVLIAVKIKAEEKSEFDFKV